jgi:hypothetical protein
VAGFWGLAPVLQSQISLLISANNPTARIDQQIALTNIFSISGTGITQYMLWFGWNAGGYPALGTVTNNGVAVALDQPVILTDLSELVYTGSTNRALTRFGCKPTTGAGANGSWTEADIGDQGAVAPTVLSNNFSLGYGDQLSLASIFGVTGSGITQYKLWFSWGSGGYPALGTLTNNGLPSRSISRWRSRA